MKLQSDVLLEIVDIVRTALLNQQDCSELLRDLDLEEEDGVLRLSDTYLSVRGRKRADL